MSYFVPLPITRLQVSVGGELLVFDMQQLQALHIIDQITDDHFTYDSPVIRNMKYSYRIDLRRFMEDLFGSSAKQTTTV